MWFKDLVLGSEDSFYINLITLESFIALSIRVRKGVERSTSEKSLRIVHSRITIKKGNEETLNFWYNFFLIVSRHKNMFDYRQNDSFPNHHKPCSNVLLHQNTYGSKDISGSHLRRRKSKCYIYSFQ